MDIIGAEVVGVINIIVYQTSQGYNFFKIQGNNENLIPVLDIIEDTLIKY